MNDYYLRPCPLCGSRAKLWVLTEKNGSLSDWYIRCEECGLDLEAGDDENTSQTIKKWNSPWWINVEDHLPEENSEGFSRPVLCWYEYYRFSDDCMVQDYGIGRTIDGKWAGDVTVGRGAKVLYWMPISDPPISTTNFNKDGAEGK